MSLNNIWDQLNKLTEQEIKDLGIDYIDEYSSILPENVVTDGEGNFYKIPESGYTKVDELENDKYFKYRYNWTTNEIEVFLKNDVIDDNKQNMELIESVGVSAYDFIDNPEYWYNTIAENIEENTGIDLRDFEIEEAIESINIESSEEGNNHQIICEYNIEMKDDNEQTTFEDFNKFVEEYKNYLEHYELSMQLYDATLIVTLQLSEDQEYVIININYPVELSDEELKTIFDDCKTYISGIASDYFYINSVNILNIIK